MSKPKFVVGDTTKQPSPRRYRRKPLGRQCIACGAKMTHWSRPLDTGEAFRDFAVTLAAKLGIAVEDVYPSSRCGRKKQNGLTLWLSALVDCYIAHLHHVGHTQKAIAAAISVDGKDKTSYVNRAVSEWRSFFPKRTRLSRVEEEEEWFREHTRAVHGEEALAKYDAERHRSTFNARMWPWQVLRDYPTEEKSIVIDPKEGETKVMQDYDPRPAAEFALRNRVKRFGRPTSPEDGAARFLVAQRVGESSPSSSPTSPITTTTGDKGMNEKLERIESKLDELLAYVGRKPTDEEIRETVEAFIESATESR